MTNDLDTLALRHARLIQDYEQVQLRRNAAVKIIEEKREEIQKLKGQLKEVDDALAKVLKMAIEQETYAVHAQEDASTWSQMISWLRPIKKYLEGKK